MTGDYRYTSAPNLALWRQLQQRAERKRERRAFVTGCVIAFVLGTLMMRAWTLEAAPAELDFTDSGVGCIDDCIEPVR